MANPHLQVINAAVRADKQIRQLFARYIGTKEHPRGRILAAHRRALKALKGNIGNPAVVDVVISEYRQAVISAVREGGPEAVKIGVDLARAAADAWDLNLPPVTTASGFTEVAEATRVITIIVDGQAQAVLSGTLTEAQLLGGPQRVGLFAVGIVQREAANWLANITQQANEQMVSTSLEASDAGPEFVRQAVAVVDERTTPCCLGVHGQVVDLDQPFSTSNPPAYAPRQDRPPFHDYCRTSQVLVLKSMAEDGLTRDMREAARIETRLRESGRYIAPHPANAFTRVRS